MKKKLRPGDLRNLNRARFEKLSSAKLVEMCVNLHALAVEQAERLSGNSSNSSKPPSSDNPYRRNPLIDAGNGVSGVSTKPSDAPASDSPRRSAGHQMGAPGKWRSSPLIATEKVDHLPLCCASCGQSYPAIMERRCVSAHYVMDLERRDDGIGVTCRLHRYFAIGCSCGHATQSAPGRGVSSKIEGRCRNLTLTERCLVGPALATFIAGLSVRFRMSRGLVEEFLHDWLGLDLAKGTICRCIREIGLACEPVADALLTEIRASDILHPDETPWHQKGALRWLWVATNATVAVFHIGTREKTELLELIGESFLGWLVTDGYGAYRSHKKRQRCLAHLIRKAVALQEGLYADAARFGDWIARELRSLISGVAEDAGSKTLDLIIGRLKKACLLNREACVEKARALAREILNDWDAVIAFVKNSNLPPTNNEAERALRHAVISRRISYGTRTDEGSRGYAATLSVIETCRKRSIVPWKFITELLATARRGDEKPILAA